MTLQQLAEDESKRWSFYIGMTTHAKGTGPYFRETVRCVLVGAASAAATLREIETLCRQLVV